MNLGKLALYAKDGLFYTDELFSDSTTFEQNERSLLKFTAGVEIDFDYLTPKFEFTPVDVNGDTEYITGNFKTSTQVVSEGELTIWLLVEEAIEITTDNQQDE